MTLRDIIPWKKRELTAEPETESPFDALRREMNQMMDRFFTRGIAGGELMERESLWSGDLPRVNVSETEKAIQVTAELPGIEEKDLDLSLHGDTLVIRGERRAEHEEKDAHYYRRESSYGSFHRAIPLPVEVDERGIEATYNKGVLKIVLPKSATASGTRRKIAIH